MNTCVRSNVPKCTQKSLRERWPPSWIRTNPLPMLHIPQDKSNKTRESPTYRGLKELPIWWECPTKAPHIPRLGGGFTLTGELLFAHNYNSFFPDIFALTVSSVLSKALKQVFVSLSKRSFNCMPNWLLLYSLLLYSLSWFLRKTEVKVKDKETRTENNMT